MSVWYSREIKLLHIGAHVLERAIGISNRCKLAWWRLAVDKTPIQRMAATPRAILTGEGMRRENDDAATLFMSAGESAK